MYNLSKLFVAAIFFLVINIAFNANAQEYKVLSGVSAMGNNSDVIDYDVPNKLSPGQDYAVTITMINNGKNKWSKGENFYLKLYDIADNKYQSDVWGIKRVDVPYDVFPQDKVIFLFKITAPQTSGVYNLRWAMSKDSDFFGEYTNNIVNVGGDNIAQVSEFNGNNSEFISISIPETMTAGEKYNVRITMKNTGNVEWLPASYNDYKITPVVESSEITFPEWNSAPVYLSSAVPPGQTSDIEFNLTAPADPGVYNLQWMMKKGDNYFGQKSNRVAVNVSRNSSRNPDSRTYNAAFIEQNVPITMFFNESQDISVTMSNTGSKTWISGNEQMVLVDAKMSPLSLNSWDIGYIQLPENVDPGKLVTIKFKVKPTDTGWQYFQMVMIKEDGTIFGSPTQSVEVLVSKR